MGGEHHIPHFREGGTKVALVHDFLLQMGGAEKVVEVLHGMFPTAPLYTSAYDPKAMPAYYRSWDIRTSFLQRLPLKSRLHRAALVLYPLAFESFDLSAYDLVISSSSAFAKGVITQPHTMHLCYTHTPMRYAWNPRTYMENERVNRVARALLTPQLHHLRLWDAAAAQRPDYYLANSSVVAARIRKFYRRDSAIVHPPVDTARFVPSNDRGDYYMVVSRFVPYKRLDLAIDAFSQLGLPLKVVGDGRQREALQARAGTNVEFLGHVSDQDLPRLVARARAFVMPGEEDFGIAPVEAMACGVPVIAFGAGGALDTQRDGVTGVLFQQPTVCSLCDAVRRFETLSFDPMAIRAHSRCFDQEAFQKNIAETIAQILADRALPAMAPPRLREQVI